MFHRVRHGILNIQAVVQPNDKRTGNPLSNAIQGAAISVSDQQLRGEFDQEVGTAGQASASLVVGRDVREAETTDQAVKSLGRWRR